ncbi:hypothetical protein P7K49_034077, partial [Saguinus oedipus]
MKRRRVLGARPCPAVVKASPGDARSFTRVGAACDEPRKWQYWPRSGAKRQAGVRLSGTGRPPQPPPRPLPPPQPPDRAQQRLLLSARPAGPREPQSAPPGRAKLIAGAIPARPGYSRRRHHRGAGHGPGAGRRAGAALFPASPEASLSLRWEPSWRASQLQ